MHTTLTASELPDKVSAFRSAIEKAVPHGRSHHGRRGDNGSFRDAPRRNAVAWRMLRDGYERVLDKHPQLDRNTHPANQLGTLGIGNHFIEVCLDESDDVWFVLHSGSRASCPKTQTNSRTGAPGRLGLDVSTLGSPMEARILGHMIHKTPVMSSGRSARSTRSGQA